jgi:tripartite-type tricarboxylate transporter receptor subunit TctC
MKKLLDLSARVAVGATIAMAMLQTGAFAQDKYPSRPVQIILPLPPGGALDVFVRGLGQAFTERTGVQVVVVNRAGGNTIVAANACKDSPADGYHVCFLTRTTVSINPVMYKTLSYAPLKDFEPIVNGFYGQQIVILNKSVPANSLSELVQYSKEHPDKLNYASVGTGGDSELIMEWLKHVTGLKVTHIPFKGFPDAKLAFDANRVQMFALLVGNPGLAQQVQKGDVKGLLLDSASRSELVPNVPTFGDAGLADAATLVTPWFGFFAPKGTPREYVTKLNKEINSIIADPKFQAKYMKLQGFTPVPSTPEEFASFLQKDRALAASYVKMSGVTLGQP